MDFELTRRENDERLLHQLEDIRSAKNIKVLVPFAKAFLGMFYVIEKELAAEDKVRLLANSELAEAVLEGFISSLSLDDIHPVEEIGRAMAEHKEFAEGYVMLAAMKLLFEKDREKFNDLNTGIIESATGFHFSNKTGMHNHWFEYLLEQDKNKIFPGLIKYWQALLQNGATYLPGQKLVFAENPDKELVSASVLLLLENWKNCKTKHLYSLLQLAFIYADENAFLKLVENVLSDADKLSEKARLYWLTSAYLLNPDQYYAHLTNYAGRVKLKIMPLLDFVSDIVSKQHEVNIELGIKTVSQLLRAIAPIFPPQYHVYGAIGELDINSKNVLLLFYFIASSNDQNVIAEIKKLRKARVMKIYSDVFDNLLEIHMRRNNEKNYVVPGFNDYIEQLVEKDCLHGRSNRFDLH